MNPIKSIIARRQTYLSKNYEKTKHGKKIAKLKDIHKGEKCFIIGNGPSLRPEDMTILHQNKIISFGANRIYNIFDKTPWRPTYYACEDEFVLEEIKDKVEELDIEYKFIPAYWKWYKGLNIKSATYYNILLNQSEIRASENMAKYSVLNGTVTGFFFQMAVYMGFKEIYLIGVDHNFSRMTDKNGNLIIDKNVKDHYGNVKNADENTKGIFNIDNATQTFIYLKEYCDSKGVKVYNATRGGKLEVFPRVDFDNLFNKEN
ncbi:MAG: DUF115 domain-containing protein [Ruminococcaceae bacterium]|nr:DUF115 domain-containing protein [Oscillospiraceae bacterium]